MKTPIQTDIGGLRAISVVMVVLYHFNLRILGGGFIGVDIFFVISGYLMTRIIHTGMLRGDFTYGGFLLKRGLRILPALLAMVLALLLLGAVLLPPPDLANLARQSLRAIPFISNDYYAGQQGYFSEGIDDRWLLHTWSLSVEWQFYMLYPAIVWLGLKLGALAGPRRAGAAFGALMLAVFAGSLALCLVLDHQQAFFSVATRSWQMIAGGLVFLGRDLRPLRPLRGAPLSYAGLAVIAAAVGVVHALRLEQRWPGAYAILPVLGACMVLAARHEHNPLLNNTVMQRLGAWSYSIYLWHWPLVIGMTITGLMTDHSKLAKLIGIPLSIALGYLSYRYIEPVRWLRAGPPARGALSLGTAGAALLALSAAINLTGGLAMRTAEPALFASIAATAEATTYAPECENTGAERSRTCRLNAGRAGDKILVLGDSHAGHLYPWFAKRSERDTTFYVKSGCPVIPGFDRLGKDNHCPQFSEHAYRMAASGAYQTVIVSQNWTYFSPVATGICSMEDGRCVTPRDSRNPELPVQRTRAALEALLARGINVVVVDATPHFGFNVPKRISRNLYWRGKITERARSEVLLPNNVEYDRLFAALRLHPRFTLVSLRRQLCEADQCLIFDKQHNVPVFMDMAHFNPEWISRNGDQFLPFAGAPARHAGTIEGARH